MKKLVSPLNIESLWKEDMSLNNIKNYNQNENSVTAWSSSETYIIYKDGTWTKLSKKKNLYPQVPLFSRKVCRQQLIQCSNMECIGCPYEKFSDPGYTCQDRLRYDAWYYLKEYDIGDIVND